MRLLPILLISLLLSACGGSLKPDASQTSYAKTQSVTTTFAKIDDVEALPTRVSRSKALYSEWLTKSSPRAFVLAGDGTAYRTWGVTTDPAVPQAVPYRAIYRCQRAGKLDCKLYAVDNAVVWTQ